MEHEEDPVIVVIPGGDGNMDDWLASLVRDDPPIDLGMTAAELIAEVRREAERPGRLG